MKKRIATILFTLLLGACANSEPPFLGTWTGSDPDDSTVTIEFQSDAVIGTYNGETETTEGVAYFYSVDEGEAVYAMTVPERRDIGVLRMGEDGSLSLYSGGVAAAELTLRRAD